MILWRHQNVMNYMRQRQRKNRANIMRTHCIERREWIRCDFILFILYFWVSVCVCDSAVRHCDVCVSIWVLFFIHSYAETKKLFIWFRFVWILIDSSNSSTLLPPFQKLKFNLQHIFRMASMNIWKKKWWRNCKIGFFVYLPQCASIIQRNFCLI